MKLYIHRHSCIYPQVNFEELDKTSINEAIDNRLKALEPSYQGIPRGVLRRMGKAVRIGVGAALPLIQNTEKLSGVILGTANGGMEDCVKFFNQIIDYDEGNLTPTNFVQSTTNAISSQIGLMNSNRGHNNTHVHAGLAFENALIDVYMQLRHDPTMSFLVGGVDEISDYNYNIDFLGGWNKVEESSNVELYNSTTVGSIAGEGAAMFVISGKRGGAETVVEGLKTVSTDDFEEVQDQLDLFLKEHFMEGNMPDLILSGENGDIREDKFYENLQGIFPNIAVARYKHLSGEFPTANALGLWFGVNILESGNIPETMHKSGEAEDIQKILIHNTYHQSQHSFIVLSKVIKE